MTIQDAKVGAKSATNP